MKQIVCEMCNGTEFSKQDGMFVCQSCGTKYSVEEAKKLMVEVEGSPKSSSAIENYYKMAESAYASSNLTEAETYCNKILEIDAENYKVWLLKGKAAGWQSSLAKLRLDEAINCFVKAIENAPESDSAKIKEEVSQEAEKFFRAIANLSCNHYKEFPSKENALEVMENILVILKYSALIVVKCGSSVDNHHKLEKELSALMIQAALDAWNQKIVHIMDNHPNCSEWEEYLQKGEGVLSIWESSISLLEEKSTLTIQTYKNMIAVQKNLITSCSYKYYNGVGWGIEYKLTDSAKAIRQGKITEWQNKLKEIDPTYEIPQPPPPAPKGGCYVATCVYGSYDCPPVWTLRRYRDYTLGQTWYGRAFIHTYYAISPTLVKWFGDTKWFKNLWKPKLDRMVKRLNEKGVEDTPYNDKTW